LSLWPNDDRVAPTVNSGKTSDDAFWPNSKPLAQGATHFYETAMHATIVVER